MIPDKILKNELHSLDIKDVVEQGKNVYHSDNYVFIVHIDLDTEPVFVFLGGSPDAETMEVVKNFDIFDVKIMDSEGDYVKTTEVQDIWIKEYLDIELKY